MTPTAHTPRDERELEHLLHSLADRGACLGRGERLSRAKFERLGPVAVQSMTVTAEAGVSLERVERELEASGLSLGPLPPGALELDVAAFLEGPLAGLRAIPPGRLEPVAVRLRGLLADGSLVETSTGPRSATGPDLGALFLGGDGRLALLTAATLRAYPQAEEQVERRFTFASGQAFVGAVCAALADGLWPWSLCAAARGGAVNAEVHLWGSAAQVQRELGTLQRAASGFSGVRTTGEAPRAPASNLVEATWEAVAEALSGGASLELHRPSLATVLVRGEVSGLEASRPSGWVAPPGLQAALDPAGVLGGAR